MIEFIKPFNIILAIDAYKANHYLELPRSAEYTWVSIVPRKPSKYADKIVAMGQTVVASMFANVRVTTEMVDEAELEITEQGYTFNRKDWDIVVNEFGGRLPLAMYAVEEGRVVDPQTPILGIVNTDKRFAWLPANVETVVQSTVWKMSTVASICRACRLTLKRYFEMTGADIGGLEYALHNFGDRGADSPDEAPVLAGIAHATQFSGSDCTRVNRYIKALYGTNQAFTSSVEATEHSVMCANSDAANRDDFGAALMAVDRLEKVVERTKQGIGIPVMSVVIDTYDSRRFVREYMGTQLKDRILASGGKMVFRPDSGNPRVEPGMVGHDVFDTFGGTINPNKYIVLHPQTAVLQGDGIRVDTIEGVVKGWVEAGFSMDSFVLGMGSGVTHDGARDDFSFSMKATASFQDGRWVRLLKEPTTDVGKKSLSGLVRCKEVDGVLQVVDVTDQPEQLFETGPGWRLWAMNGDRVFSQSYESVRNFARS